MAPPQLPEAATDLIAAAHATGTAEPWMDRSFIDVITTNAIKAAIR